MSRAISGSIDRESGVPAYEQVKRRLREMIVSGTWARGEQIPPEPEIAKQLGVSRMTANRALSELAQEGWLTRRKGMGTFVDSEPVAAANVRILLHEDPIGSLDDYYFGRLLAYLSARLGEKGHQVATARWDDDDPESLTTGCDLAVFINPRADAMRRLTEVLPRSAIALGATWLGVQAPSVDSDNFAGVAIAYSHLARLGHRRIAFVGACPKDSNTVDRVSAYRVVARVNNDEAFGEKLIVFPVARTFEADERVAVSKILTESPRPTAVIAAGPHVAMLVLAEAARAGLRVPDDLSIVAYDDPPFLSLTHPAMTTVNQPLDQLAEAAVRAIQALIEPGQPDVDSIALEPELIVRESTAPPAS